MIICSASLIPSSDFFLMAGGITAAGEEDLTVGDYEFAFVKPL